MRYEILNNVLFINGNHISFPEKYEDLKALEYLDILVIMVDYEVKVKKDISNRNIYAFGPGAKMLWRVAEFPNLSEDHPDAPYTNIFVDKDGKLQAYNWIGFPVFINPKDGSVELLPGKQRPW